MKLDGKETLLKKSLHNYFDKKEEEIKLIRNILNSVDRISLRILDWFVTNYSKKNNTTIGSIYVYNSYKSQLKAYSKKFFDPFCRREKINFHYNDTDYIYTTIGQMCFFRWIFNNNILNYIYQNIEKIEEDMYISFSKKIDKDKSTESLTSSPQSSQQSSPQSSSSSYSKRKRREITGKITDNEEKINIVLNFD